MTIFETQKIPNLFQGEILSGRLAAIYFILTKSLFIGFQWICPKLSVSC